MTNERLVAALRVASSALAPFALRCEEAVRDYHSDLDGQTVTSGELRTALDARRRVESELAELLADQTETQTDRTGTER